MNMILIKYLFYPDVSFPEVDYSVDVIGNDELSVGRWHHFYAV